MDGFIDKIFYILAVVGFFFIGKKIHSAYVNSTPDSLKLYWNAYEAPLRNYTACRYVQDMMSSQRVRLKNDFKDYKKRGYAISSYHPFHGVLMTLPDQPSTVPNVYRAWAACQLILDINDTLSTSLLSYRDSEYQLLESIKKEQIKYLSTIIDNSDDPANETLFYFPDDLARYPDIAPKSLLK